MQPHAVHFMGVYGTTINIFMPQPVYNIISQSRCWLKYYCSLDNFSKGVMYAMAPPVSYLCRPVQTYIWLHV